MATQTFCRSRTIGRLKYLPLGILLILLGACCLIYGLFGLEEGDPAYYRYVAPILGGVLALAGVVECFLSLRDALFPARSALAKSIRAQLPYPDEAPDVQTLFEMVDRDLTDNARWFGKIAVGKEWVFGDEAVRIDRIRGIFYAIETRRANQRVNYSYYLKLVDDRQKLYVLPSGNESDLKDAYNYIRLLVPEAWLRDVTAFLNLPEEEFAAFNRDFCVKRDKRIAQEQEQAADQALFPQDTILYQIDGVSTSRVTPALLKEQLDKLQENQQFRLQLLWEFSMPQCGTLKTMTCVRFPQGYWIVSVYQKEDGSAAWGRQMTREEALDCLTHLLNHQAKNPVQDGWQPVEVRDAPAASRREAVRNLTVQDQTGLTHEYAHFSREDVVAAADGLLDGHYKNLLLALGQWGMTVGREESGSFTVHSRRPGAQMRFYTTTCGGEQARQWLLDLMDGCLSPDYSRWQDVTEEVLKRARQQNKA